MENNKNPDCMLGKDNCRNNSESKCDRCDKNMCNADNSGMCGCVGYAYVPEQMFYEMYCAEKALCRGTAFPELDLPIDEYGMVCKRKGRV